MMNNKWPTQGSKSLYFYQALTFNREILTKIPRKPNILMTIWLCLIANWIEIIIFKNSSALLLCNMNRLRINNAACGGSVLRRVFSNTNDKTFPSSLNNLLYSHQQFLPEPTATSHASSPLHVLHQASSFIKKLTIMTQPRMIEQRREFITSRYLNLIIQIFHNPTQHHRGVSQCLEKWEGPPSASGPAQVWHSPPQTLHHAHPILRPLLRQTRRICFRIWAPLCKSVSRDDSGL